MIPELEGVGELLGESEALARVLCDVREDAETYIVVSIEVRTDARR